MGEEEDNMTQKELLYLEDAIGHEKSIISIIEESIKNLENEDLVSFMENELNCHTEKKKHLLNMLEVKANE